MLSILTMGTGAAADLSAVAVAPLFAACNLQERLVAQQTPDKQGCAVRSSPSPAYLTPLRCANCTGLLEMLQEDRMKHEIRPSPPS
jgi:hypothetical protein